MPDYSETSIKHCAGCDTDKQRSEFYKHAKRYDGRQARCKACVIKQSQEWRAANPERDRASQRAHRLRTDFGISVEEYDALLAAQGGVCAGCREPCASGNRLAVDHDHETGEVRGLLCVRCNRAVGFVRDNPATLRNLANYLDGGGTVRPGVAGHVPVKQEPGTAPAGKTGRSQRATAGCGTGAYSCSLTRNGSTGGLLRGKLPQPFAGVGRELAA